MLDYNSFRCFTLNNIYDFSRQELSAFQKHVLVSTIDEAVDIEIVFGKMFKYLLNGMVLEQILMFC